MRAERPAISARAISAAAPRPTTAGSASAPARLPPSSIPPSISGCRRAPGRTTSAPAQGGAPRAGPPTTRASASIASMSTGTSPAVSPASTATRASGRAARAAAARAGTSWSVPMSGWPWTRATRAVSSRIAAARSPGATRPSPSTADQIEARPRPPGRAAGGQRRRVLDGARDDVPAERAVAGQEALHREVARLDGSGGEDHPLLVGPHQLGHLAARPLQGLGGPAAPLVEARRAAERVVQERRHGLAHPPVEGRGGRVVEVGAARHRPSARRWASSDGSPAWRIAFWAAATS